MITSLSLVWLLFFLVIASGMATAAFGFSLPQPSRSSSTRTRPVTTALPAENKNYPPLSRDEVQAMLDTVPVYAVRITESEQEGLVLLKEKNNPNEIAYFFFSSQAANAVFSSLRKTEKDKSGQGEWNIAAFPLGLVWFELIDAPVQGIEYRLLPDADDLSGARNLLREQQAQSGVPDPQLDDLFRSPCNQVPVFVDQFLRVTVPRESSAGDDDGQERVPMYFSLKDLTATCSQAVEASAGEYQAAMSAIDLRDLVGEMTREGGGSNDYRRVVLIPPTPAVEEGSPDSKAQSAPPKDRAAAVEKSLEGNEEIATPTATNDWSD